MDNTIQSTDLTERGDLCTKYENGQKVTLDADFANTSTVTVLSQTPKRMFTTVTDGQSEWNVMTYRLTKTK